MEKILSRFAAKCGDTNTTFDWGCTGNNETAITDVIITIFNWLSIGVVIVIIGVVVVGAIQYMTGSSGGEEGKTQGGIKTIINAVMALGLYFAMWSILNFLVPGGVFNQ